MPIRDIDHDPRSPGQKLADQELLASVESGHFPSVSPADRKAAIARIREKHQARE